MFELRLVPHQKVNVPVMGMAQRRRLKRSASSVELGQSQQVASVWPQITKTREPFAGRWRVTQDSILGSPESIRAIRSSSPSMRRDY